MILKAGTYRWNDVLTYQGFDLDDEFSFNFVIGDSTSTAQCTGIQLFVTDGDIFIDGYLPDFTHPSPYENGYWHETYMDMMKTVTLETDQTVSVLGYEDDEEYLNEIIPEFIKFFIANTNYNEINAPSYLAEITYNGETIAQLNAGETATLSCEGKKMVSDVVVKVDEVESKIPEGYVKPEGTLNILQNNTTYDVSQYAEVRIATAHPYEVPLEMLMNNVISDASQATIGNVYKYTGETTDTYEKNVLYQLFEDEKTGDKYLKKLVISSGGGGASAYTVSSVDELPSNAVVGSLAKVKAQHSFYGEYWLSPIISMPYNQFEGVFFECDGFNYKTVVGYGTLQYERVTGDTITVYENNAWIDEKYRRLKVYSGENTAFKVWLNENRENFQGAETWEFYEAERYADGIKWFIIDPNRVSVVQE